MFYSHWPLVKAATVGIAFAVLGGGGGTGANCDFGLG